MDVWRPLLPAPAGRRHPRCLQVRFHCVHSVPQTLFAPIIWLMEAGKLEVLHFQWYSRVSGASQLRSMYNAEH